MTKIVRLVLFCVCYSCIALAEVPYKEAEGVLPEIATLEGKLISVHGLIDKLEKDGISANMVIISLDGGLKCRISRDAFKNRKTSSGKTERSFVFKNVGRNELKIEYQGKQILNQGTDVIIRGTVKKETTTWILDRAIIRGCSDPEAREGMDIRCGGPCNSGSRYYGGCGICRDPDEIK